MRGFALFDLALPNLLLLLKEDFVFWLLIINHSVVPTRLLCLGLLLGDGCLCAIALRLMSSVRHAFAVEGGVLGLGHLSAEIKGPCVSYLKVKWFYMSVFLMLPLSRVLGYRAA